MFTRLGRTADRETDYVQQEPWSINVYSNQTVTQFLDAYQTLVTATVIIIIIITIIIINEYYYSAMESKNFKSTHTHTHPFNGPFSGTTQVST